MDVAEERLEELIERLSRLEMAIMAMTAQKTVKTWYSTDEVAALLGKRPFTVREWCRLGRVNAEKRDCGRGRATEWIISHDELERLRNFGLLPLPKYRHYR